MTANLEETDPSTPVLPMSVQALLTARTGIISAWQEAARADDAVGVAFAKITDPDFQYRFDREKQRRDDADPHYIKPKTAALDFSLWEFAVSKLNLTRVMTGAKADEFIENIKVKKTPFCEAELAGLFQNAGRIFRESSLNTVQEVYRSLIGAKYRSGDWRVERKSDNLRKVEKVFRIGYSDLKVSNYRDGLELDWRRIDNTGSFHFNDLLTACRLIEGQGLTDYSNSFDAYVRAVSSGHVVDCVYFRATAYLNGNVKVNWNEDKIHVLEKLNAIGSGRENDLPDTMRKRYKSEHFHDGGMPKAETFFKVDPNDKRLEPDATKDFAFYPTPVHVAQRMVTLAEFPPMPESGPREFCVDVLEPSAGLGDLLEHIPFDFGNRAIEFNHHRAEALRAKTHGWVVLEEDFLTWKPEHAFDRVIMNPPFNDRVEGYHLVKAFSHLKPGGILVAILPEGWFFREDSKPVIMREFLTRHEYKPTEKLEAGTFGRTRIQTRIVTLKKPEAKA